MITSEPEFIEMGANPQNNKLTNKLTSLQSNQTSVSYSDKALSFIDNQNFQQFQRTQPCLVTPKTQPFPQSNYSVSSSNFSLSQVPQLHKERSKSSYQRHWQGTPANRNMNLRSWSRILG